MATLIQCEKYKEFRTNGWDSVAPRQDISFRDAPIGGPWLMKKEFDGKILHLLLHCDGTTTVPDNETIKNW